MTKAGIYSQVEPENHLLHVSVIGDVPDADALRDGPGIWQRHPEVVDYNTLLDLTRDHGRISWDTIRTIARQWTEFSAGRDCGRRTAVLIRGDEWEAYARVLATIFADRAFKTFRSAADARVWLRGSGRASVRRVS